MSGLKACGAPLVTSWSRLGLMQLSRLVDAPNLLRLLARGVRGDEIGFSFNVADRCPIGCDCYWKARPRVSEMTDEDVVGFFREMRDRGYLLATLVGGEPYVRPKLLERLAPIMPATWLVTSGTTPLRHLPKTVHFVSIDGADAATHDQVRKSPRLFERIVCNLESARADGCFPAVGHTVLNSQNHRQIGDILDFWSRNGLLDGVLFSTLTPIRGGDDGWLRLSRAQQAVIARDLAVHKRRHGAFLMNTDRMIELLKPETMARQRPDACATARLVASFDAAGDRIEQCILGGQADCTQCGCVITSMLETTFPRPRPSTLRMLARLRATQAPRAARSFSSQPPPSPR
jgi:hypothetical protein